MSDGHSDSSRFSRFYEANLDIKRKQEQHKLEKMCVVLNDGTIRALDGIQLLFSEKYETGQKVDSTSLLSANGSRMLNLREIVRELIRRGMV